MGIQGTIERTVPAAPDAVFALLSEPGRLPEWNRIITGVVEAPDEMRPGARWVVEMRAMGQSWRSRSWLEELDRDSRVIRYRSGTDDDNPSYARWHWEVAPGAAEGTARVVVTWELCPQTFWRRLLVARLRNRQLRRTEVPASIAALAAALVRA